MPDRHTQDAYLAVTVPLPNGRTISGTPVLYPDAMRMLALADAFAAGGKPTETLGPLLADFHRVTGIAPAAFAELTLGEVYDTVMAFFYSRRPVPAAPPTTVTAPAGSPPPA